jgi:uncharacterized protein (DUF58 family)
VTERRLSLVATRTPERPGPGPVPDPVLRSLDLAVLRRVQSLVPGEYQTPQVGLGTELQSVRPYRPGDDVRHIDWNVTARLQEPHVRVHLGERAMTAWLALDVSSSMAFGTALRRKADVAEGVALAVGHVATRRGNRLGVVAFGDGPARVLRPRQGRLGLLGLLAELRAQGARDGDPELARRRSAAHEAPPPGHAGAGHAVPAGVSELRDVGDRLAALARSHGLVVIVSDFRGPLDWEPALRTLRARHGVIAVEIRDPRELSLPPVGDVWMVDPESGRQVVVNTNRRRVRERFAAAAAEERAAVGAALARAGADHLVLDTATDWLRDLAGHLRRAERLRVAALSAGVPGRAATVARRQAPLEEGAFS